MATFTKCLAVNFLFVVFFFHRTVDHSVSSFRTCLAVDKSLTSTVALWMRNLSEESGTPRLLCSRPLISVPTARVGMTNLTEMVFPGGRRPSGGWTRYRSGVLVLILKA
jgi:hypothetical protein